MEHIAVYPWIEGDIKPGSTLVFHLSRETRIRGYVHSAGEFVILDDHFPIEVDKIFKAFNTPIPTDRFEIWPSSKDTLSLLRKWKGQSIEYSTTTESIIEEPIQSLTNNTKQNATFELQDQRVNFRRTEVPRGNILRCRITEAAISIGSLSYTKISC